MISIMYPEIRAYVKQLPIGLMPIDIKADIIPKLIVKSSKELILTAKLRKEFLIYLVPYEIPGVKSVGFLAAFFDDAVHPLVTGGALIKELAGRELSKLFLSPKVDVHFFNELGWEMLAYRAEFKSTKRHRDLLRSAVLPSVKGLNQSAILTQMDSWFSATLAADDQQAIRVVFKERLMPDDVVHIDMNDENHRYHGAPLVSSSPLEREEPGAFQEREIISILHRVFSPDQIYLAPLRTYDKEEMVDVLVVTKKSVLLIQAKDGPNIERIVNNTISRKVSTSHKALKAAAGQIKGAIAYMRRAAEFVILVKGKEVKLDLSGKSVYGMAVIKELFNHEYEGYTPPLLELYAKTGVPCIPLSYGELHQHTSYIDDEDELFKAFMTIFNHGLETGVFSRLRVLPPGSIINK
ncbi:hypothetical protein PspCFBP13506_05415 [Pseudomonas sp. CFBP13506]|uniref:hypothetical protein n=1 Tax=Pseudomonas sp. CFBP13506 TaxID=2184010 RepID=UPI0010C05BCB|nr:hypothetical protein [Pseudomonas sp. CFBP13506]TKJ63967.1 hypothetical protein PspCFBP13506_05415 [Pseudomonas sp. CFBP13506]